MYPYFIRFQKKRYIDMTSRLSLFIYFLMFNDSNQKNKLSKRNPIRIAFALIQDQPDLKKHLQQFQSPSKIIQGLNCLGNSAWNKIKQADKESFQESAISLIYKCFAASVSSPKYFDRVSKEENQITNVENASDQNFLKYGSSSILSRISDSYACLIMNLKLERLVKLNYFQIAERSDCSLHQQTSVCVQLFESYQKQLTIQKLKDYQSLPSRESQLQMTQLDIQLTSYILKSFKNKSTRFLNASVKYLGDHGDDDQCDKSTPIFLKYIFCEGVLKIIQYLNKNMQQQQCEKMQFKKFEVQAKMLNQLHFSHWIFQSFWQKALVQSDIFVKSLMQKLSVLQGINRTFKILSKSDFLIRSQIIKPEQLITLVGQKQRLQYLLKRQSHLLIESLNIFYQLKKQTIFSKQKLCQFGTISDQFQLLVSDKKVIQLNSSKL